MLLLNRSDLKSHQGIDILIINVFSPIVGFLCKAKRVTINKIFCNIALDLLKQCFHIPWMFCQNSNIQCCLEFRIIEQIKYIRILLLF